MANVPESNIKATPELPHVTINANGTDYKVSVFLSNNRGEAKFIDSNTFNSIVFESNHNTPFLLGSLYEKQGLFTQAQIIYKRFLISLNGFLFQLHSRESNF